MKTNKNKLLKTNRNKLMKQINQILEVKFGNDANNLDVELRATCEV